LKLCGLKPLIYFVLSIQLVANPLQQGTKKSPIGTFLFVVLSNPAN
jgi:hypothetical protein